ncbi:MAG TPA: hypothetical protein VKU41_17365 [Polyangiaceae bacterium]|nr:hypothetical protein [Polyangiaceae bacterium]
MKWGASFPHLVRRWRLPLLAALATTIVFSLPQWIYWYHGNRGALLLHYDEPDYVGRLVRALQGHTTGSPWTVEHGQEPGLVPSYVETALAAPFRLACRLGVCASPDTVLVSYRVVLPALGVMIVADAFYAAGMPLGIAALVAFWAYCEPSLVQYQPLIGLVVPQSFLSFDRFSNPLVGVPLFFGAWGCLARAFGPRNAPAWAVAAGVLCGALFYTSFFYWTFFFAVAAGTTALALSRDHLRASITALGVGVLVAVPYWVGVVALRHVPHYADLAWRNGVLIHDRGLFYYSNKTMWIFVAGSAGVWFLERETSRFLVGSLLGGLALFYSSLVTNVAVQNSHWHYTLAPMLLGACVWGAERWLRDRRPALTRPLGIAVSLAVAVVGFRTAARWLRVTDDKPLPGTGDGDRPYAGAWRWLRDHAGPDDVVLASEQTMGYVPLRTGRFVWHNAHAGTSAAGFEEILERNQVLWWLSRMNVPAFEKRLCAIRGRGVEGWDYGLTPELQASLESRGRPPFDPGLSCQLAQVVGNLQALVGPGDIRNMGRKYRVDYLVRGPAEEDWGRADQLLRLAPVFEEGSVRVDRIEGWVEDAVVTGARQP